MKRYLTSKQFNNSSELYQTILQNKKLNSLNQYTTFNFGKLKKINESGISSIFHTVDVGERLEKISQRYYNSPDYGWLILFTNAVGSELDLYIGQSLTIYYPIEDITSLMLE